MKINIAIDGPSAAGKSTIADILAERLGYTHLDTGAMYRAVAYNAFLKEIPLDDEDQIVAMIEKMDLVMLPDGRVILDGDDVSDEIRTNEVSMGASDVSKLQRCREAMVAMQQKICEEGGYILDGRDIGTTVFPDAELKIFMTADPMIRAERRAAEMRAKGDEVKIEDVLKNLQERDYIDSHREASPLTQAEDAIVLDNSNMTMEDQMVWLRNVVSERFGC